MGASTFRRTVLLPAAALAAALLALLLSCGGGGGGGPTPQWGAAVNLEPSNDVPSTCLRMGSDNAGNALAIWERRNVDTGQSLVWAARYSTATDRWTTEAGTVQSDPAGDGEHPNVAVSPAGNGLVAWEEDDAFSGEFRIWARRYTAGGGWEAPVRVDDHASGEARDPIVAALDNGDGAVVWKWGNPDVWVSRRAGGSWTAPVNLSDAGDSAVNERARVALAANGDAFVAWVRTDPGDGSYSIRASRFDHGTGAWSSPADLGASSREWPWVAADRSGNAWVLFGSDTGARAARFDASGGSWQAAVAVSLGSNANPALEPQVAFASDGSLLALWAQSDGTANVLWSNRLPAGGSWGTAAKLPGVSGGCKYQHLAPAAAGAVAAAWVEEKDPSAPPVGRSYRTRSSAYRPGSGWSAPVAIDNASGGDVQDAYVSAGVDGPVAAIWRQQVDVGGNLVYQVHGNRLR